MKAKLACGHRGRPFKRRIVKHLQWLWCPVCRSTAQRINEQP